eukprot:16444297-Heterocapsa_arctica.AAC.1
MINNLNSIDPELERDTEWLAMRLSGGHGPPPGLEGSTLQQHDDIVRLVHARTPNKANVKSYVISKVEGLPGAIMSTKGKTTRVQNFVDALGKSALALFRHIDVN